MEPEAVTYVYETLDPFSFFGSGGDEPPQTYSILRSEVTSSLCPSSQPDAGADYFSLEVGGDASKPGEEEGHLSPPPPDTSSARDVKLASESAWFHSGRRFKSPMLQLHKEIVDFCKFVSPTPEEQASRSSAVERIFEVIKYIWPHCSVEVFGSFRTSLYLPTSDIDVVIIDSKVRTPQMGLNALARALSQRSLAKKIQVIAKARVPIIKFVEKESGIAFDISFDVENGPKAADYIKDAVSKMPPLKPLCMILKVFLQQRELNEVFLGGIGSYALLAMLIAQLQMHWRGQDTRAPMEHNLGILLVNFFDLYGRKLNTWDVGVSCNRTGTFFLKSKKGFLNEERPYLLSIEDPQAPDNDIGRNSYNYFKVKSAFSMAYAKLTDSKTIMELGPDRSILGMIIRPDPVLLDRKGGCNGELTFHDLLPGADESTPVQFGDGDALYNWRLVDDEPLPRGEIVDEPTSSSRKRKDSKPKLRSDVNEYLMAQNAIQEGNGQRENRTKKQRRKELRDNGKTASNGSHRRSGESRLRRS